VTANECVNQGSCLDEPTCADACCVGTCEAVNPPAAIGAACDILANEPCVAGAFCNNDGICTAAGPVGSACQGTSDACVAPAVCLYPLGGSSGTCTVISSAPGAACIPGANFGCGRADEICDAATSRCKKVASIGAACAETYECGGYADCAARTCPARPARGPERHRRLLPRRSELHERRLHRARPRRRLRAVAPAPGHAGRAERLTPRR
jgi:hypothetical protein